MVRGPQMSSCVLASYLGVYTGESQESPTGPKDVLDMLIQSGCHVGLLRAILAGWYALHYYGKPTAVHKAC